MSEKLVVRSVFPMVLHTGSALCQVINQGTETRENLRKGIAAFAGLPTGKDLRLVRETHQNLSEVKRMWAQDG